MQYSKTLIVFLLIATLLSLVLIIGCNSNPDNTSEPVEPQNDYIKASENGAEVTVTEPIIEENIEEEPEENAYVMPDVLNLRSGPGKDYDVIDKVIQDNCLTVIGQKDEWLNVITPDQKNGWVHSDYVSYSKYYHEGWNAPTGLYKVSIFGTLAMKITEEPINSIKVFGDWIYIYNFDEDFNIFRISADGSKREHIIDSNYRFEFITVFDDWIFYHEVEELENRLFYITRVDGTERKKLTDSWVGHYIVYDDDLYFEKSDEDGYGLYRFNLSSLLFTKISALPERAKVFFNAVVDDWIYYETYDGVTFKTNKVRTDGTGQKVIIDDYLSNHLVVINDWIYYVNSKDNDRIYKVSTDGTEVTKITEDTDVNSYEVIGDWVYYTNHQGSYIYKISTDGAERTKLTDAKTKQFRIVNDWIYYINWFDGRKIYKIHTNGTQNTKLNDGKSIITAIKNGWIYYSVFQ